MTTIATQNDNLGPFYVTIVVVIGFGSRDLSQAEKKVIVC
jgi:hypothetical protein